jgi:DNA ligase (NAD+)
MDLEGLGEKLLDQLVDGGIVQTPADLYQLEAPQVAGLERMAEKSAANLVAAIRDSRVRGLARFLYALGIRNVGEATARDLALHFGSIDRILEAEAGALQRVPDVGPVVAESIAQFFGEPHNRSVVEALRDYVEIQNPVPAAPGAAAAAGEIAGKRFVLTGTLPELSREEASRMIQARGGRVSGSVSKKTDYVVVGAEPGVKADKARELGVAVIDEAGLLELLKERT